MGKPADDTEVAPPPTVQVVMGHQLVGVSNCRVADKVQATPAEGTLRITANGHGKYRLEYYHASIGGQWTPYPRTLKSLEEARGYAEGIKQIIQETAREKVDTWTQVEVVT